MKLISKALRMARVKAIAHFYRPPTRVSTNLLLLLAVEHHRTLAGTHFLSYRE